LVRRRVRDVLPISARRRAQLKERLTEEEASRERRAAAEAEVLKMDADLRAKRIGEARLREESRRRARDEAERQIQEEADRELRLQEGRHSRDEAARRAGEAALAAASGEPVTEPRGLAQPIGSAGDDVQAISRAAAAVARAAAAQKANQIFAEPVGRRTSADQADHRIPVDPEPGSVGESVRAPLVPGFPAGAGQGRSAAERAAAAALAASGSSSPNSSSRPDDEPDPDDTSDPRSGRHR